MIMKLWKLNVCTILILPLFNQLTSNLLYNKLPILNKSPISFIQLCFLYGIKNTYLNNKHDSLVLVFDKKRTSDKLFNTNFNFWSFNEFMLNTKDYIKFEIYNDYILFYLRIDSKNKEDIDKIISSSYSSLSKEYKNSIDISKQYKVLQKVEEVSDYLCHNNIPRSIVSKEQYMKNIIESYLKIRIPDTNEYFKMFEKDKEIFSPNMLTI